MALTDSKLHTTLSMKLVNASECLYGSAAGSSSARGKSGSALKMAHIVFSLSCVNAGSGTVLSSCSAYACKAPMIELTSFLTCVLSPATTPELSCLLNDGVPSDSINKYLKQMLNVKTQILNQYKSMGPSCNLSADDTCTAANLDRRGGSSALLPGLSTLQLNGHQQKPGAK